MRIQSYIARPPAGDPISLIEPFDRVFEYSRQWSPNDGYFILEEHLQYRGMSSFALWKPRSSYYRFMSAKKVRISPVFDCVAFALTVVFVAYASKTLPAQTIPFGEKQSTVTGNLVAVYSISWPTPISDVTADVEVCAGPNASGTFAFPSFFQLRFADGGAIASYGSKKQPTFERTQLKPKQCVRGWLNFAVTSDQRPTVIRYHEMSASKKSIEWSVK